MHVFDQWDLCDLHDLRICPQKHGACMICKICACLPDGICMINMSCHVFMLRDIYE